MLRKPKHRLFRDSPSSCCLDMPSRLFTHAHRKDTLFSKSRRIEPEREMGCDGCKNISAVEGIGHILEHILLVLNPVNPAALIDCKAEQPVIRADEKVAIMFQNDSPSATSHGRVDDANVDRALAEERKGLRYEKATFRYVLWFDFVGYIDDTDIRVDRKHDAFHHPDVRVLQAEIGQQRYRLHVRRKTGA